MAAEFNLRRAVSNALVAEGFRRRERMHLLNLDSGTSIYVDTGPLGKRGDIAPFVGLRHNNVQELVARFLGLDDDPFVGTVGANVGYVLEGDYLAWPATGDAEVVVDCINRARDVLAALRALDDLPRAWDIRGTTSPGFQYRIAVVHHLRGDDAMADRWLQEARSVDCQHEDALCEQFRTFERRLLDDRTTQRRNAEY